VTREGFEAQNDKLGALMVGSPEEIAAKIRRHGEALGGIDRFTFQMDNAGLSHTQVMDAIELIGNEVIPVANA
jgi:alkanesulfonate monooxygenase SsuD/methylene tetrahydromethanopterin reductase-like flavin-dependent oxidoreductase (luciferase family)